jgi:hypothetical protein
MNARNDWSFLQRLYRTMLVGASIPAGKELLRKNLHLRGYMTLKPGLTLIRIIDIYMS